MDEPASIKYTSIFKQEFKHHDSNKVETTAQIVGVHREEDAYQKVTYLILTRNSQSHLIKFTNSTVSIPKRLMNSFKDLNLRSTKRSSSASAMKRAYPDPNHLKNMKTPWVISMVSLTIFHKEKSLAPLFQAIAA